MSEGGEEKPKVKRPQLTVIQGGNSDAPKNSKLTPVTQQGNVATPIFSKQSPDTWRGAIRKGLSSQDEMRDTIAVINKSLPGSHITLGQPDLLTKKELLTFRTLLEDVIHMKLSSNEKGALARSDTNIVLYLIDSVPILRIGYRVNGDMQPNTHQLRLFETTADELYKILQHYMSWK